MKKTASFAGTRSNTSPQQDDRVPLWHVAAIIIAVLVGVLWFLAAEHEIAGQWGFPLDDSWIYATFARNLASGHGYSFNPGESVGGATGPLHVFVLAALFLIFGELVWPAKILGALCLCASGLIVHQVARRIAPGDRVIPLFAGLLVVVSPPLLWGSLTGLELPVYLLLACIGAYFYVERRWALSITCWSVGVWLRPDGLFLLLLGLSLPPRETKEKIIRPLIAAVVILGAYLTFNYLVGGHLLPSSVGVKTHFGQNLGGSELGMLKQWADLWGIPPSGRVGLHAPILLAGMTVGALALFRRVPALVAYAFLFPFVFALFGASGGQFARYIAYVIPVTIVMALVGFDRAIRKLWPARATMGITLLCIACLAWECYTSRKAGIGLGWNVENINGMQRYIAEATRKATSPGDTVAVNDVGAMGYFSGCYVVDLVGLVSPARSFPENLSRFHPKYMAIFPDWFEKYAAVDWNTDQVVFYDADSVYKYSPFLGVRLRRNTISSRNTMYVYERMPRSGIGLRNVPLVVH